MPTPREGYWLDGDRLPSVTTIIKKFEGSDALIGWAYGQGYEHGRKGLAQNRYAKSDEAKDIGTIAHALAQAHLRRIAIDELDDYEKLPKLKPEQYAKAETAFKSYLAWERRSQLEVESLEQPLMCKCHRFGGTPDAIGLIDFDYCLIDFKTANAIYGSNLEQLAAYIHLWDVNYPDKAITGGAHLLRFPKDSEDFHDHFFGNLADAWEGFELKRRLYEIHKGLEKRVK